MSAVAICFDTSYQSIGCLLSVKEQLFVFTLVAFKKAGCLKC